MQESGDFGFQLLQEVGVVAVQRHNLPHPIACLPCVNDDGQVLVVGAKHELGEERFSALCPTSVIFS